MPKVFICYRREDSIETAGRMYSWLSMRLPEGDVFMDVKAITPGTNFPDYIEHVIATQAEIVLVVIGKAWLRTTDEQGQVHQRLEEKDDHVRREIELALERERTLVPVLVQGATMPKRDELPASVAILSDINALPVRPEPDFDNDMRRLREAILAHGPSVAFHPPVAVTPAPPYPPPGWEPPTPMPVTPESRGLWSRLFARRRRG